MNDILVSICCITYNHESYIADAIEGFLMQKTNFNFEVLIHDDASTDGTADIIREYQRKYPHVIKPIYQTENQYSKGVKVNQTYNIPRAKGKYIALCEGDDYWSDPYKLQKQIDYMERNPQCTLCCHGAEKINVNSKIVYDVIQPRKGNGILSTDRMIAEGGCIPTASFVFPKKLIINLPGFFYKVSVGDYPLQMYLSSLGYVYYIDALMSVYRTGHKGSWTMRTFSGADAKKNIIEHYKEMLDLLDSFNAATNFRFAAAVDKAKLIKEVRILEIEKKLKEIKTGRYKEYYTSLNLVRKIKLHARYYLPNAYSKIASIKNNIKLLLIAIKKYITRDLCT